MVEPVSPSPVSPTSESAISNVDLLSEEFDQSSLDSPQSKKLNKNDSNNFYICTLTFVETHFRKKMVSTNCYGFPSKGYG